MQRAASCRGCCWSQHSSQLAARAEQLWVLCTLRTMRRFGAGYAVGRPPSVARASDGASDSYGAATAAAAAVAGCGWHALRHACRPTPPSATQERIRACLPGTNWQTRLMACLHYLMAAAQWLGDADCCCGTHRNNMIESRSFQPLVCTLASLHALKTERNALECLQNPARANTNACKQTLARSVQSLAL